MTIELQPWADDDLPLVRRMNTPEMTVFLGGSESEEQLLDRHERYLRGWRDGTAWMFRIEVDGDPVGGIGYWPVEHDGAAAFETGWSVVREWQGRGVATAALRLLIRHVIDDGSRDLLLAFPGADNGASNALCRSAGFEAGEVQTGPWRGGELTCRRWHLDIAALRSRDAE